MLYGIGYNSKSLGFKTTKEGKKLASYYTWDSMLARCYNENCHNYKHYGARGVQVCAEWLDYQNFAAWFSSNYREGCQLDKDAGGGLLYSPDTCKFITCQQNNELRVCKPIKILSPTGTKYTVTNIAKFCREVGINQGNFARVCSGEYKQHKGWRLDNA